MPVQFVVQAEEEEENCTSFESNQHCDYFVKTRRFFLFSSERLQCALIIFTPLVANQPDFQFLSHKKSGGFPFSPPKDHNCFDRSPPTVLHHHAYARMWYDSLPQKTIIISTDRLLLHHHAYARIWFPIAS